MADLTRRGFTRETLTSLLTFSLLETVFTRSAQGEEVLDPAVRPIAAAWLAELDRMGRDLKDKRISATDWQEHVGKLLGEIELPALMKFMDFEKLTKDLAFRDKGERSLRPSFPEVEGLPTKLVYGHQVFALKQGRSVVPHGHDNMATAFVVLDGKFHGRHYDREDADNKTMILRPTIDERFSAGGVTTVSDERDNVHWFEATSETGFIFNIHVLGVTPGKKTGRVYVDPNGEKLADGRLRCRRLRAPEAYKLFG